MINDKYTVKNFYQNIAQKIPPLLEYQFLISITPGLDEKIDSVVNFEKLQLLCQSAVLPQNQIQTQDIFYYGKRFTVPTSQQVQHEWSTSVILTNSMDSYMELRRLMLQFSSLENNMGGRRTVPNLDIKIDILNQFM